MMIGLRVAAAVLAVVLSLTAWLPLADTNTVDAKHGSISPMGECTLYYFAHWTRGDVPDGVPAGLWLITKIVGNCDVDGSWR